MGSKNTIIMIVDDNPLNLKILANILNILPCDLQICTTGQEALDAIEIDVPDLILLDVMMPGIDGYTVCERIRSRDKDRDIPIIFLTAKVSTEDIVHGFAVGGNDYITKPFNEAELMARVTHQLALKKSRDELFEKNAQLESLIEKLATASSTDPLTGLLNRRAMMQKLTEEIARQTRHHRNLAIVMADIDYFKHVNDQYGHDCGDMVLKRIGEIIRERLRQEDGVARWGGEEFLLLLPETHLDGAMALAERVREAIQGENFTYGQFKFKVTITLGLTIFADGDNLDKAIINADSALYEGKAHGRNQVYVFQKPEE